MKIKPWLIVSRSGSVRVRKSNPDLSWDEIKIRLDLEIPDTLFVRPHLTAKVIVPEESGNPEEIPVEVQMAVEDAIKEKGYQVKVDVVLPGEDVDLVEP